MTNKDSYSSSVSMQVGIEFSQVDWSQRVDSGMCIDFILLACSISVDILVDKRVQATRTQQ